MAISSSINIKRNTEVVVRNLNELLTYYSADLNDEIFISPNKVLRIDSDSFDLGVYTIVMGENSTLLGYSQNFTYLFSSEDNHILIKGSGTHFFKHIILGQTGVSSKVFEIVGATGFEAIDLFYVEFSNGSTLGTLENIRQAFWTTGFGINNGKGFLLKGNWLGGFTLNSTRIINCGEYLLKGDVGFTCNNIRSNVNITVPNGAVAFDFDYIHFNVDEAYQLNGCNVDGLGEMCSDFITGDSTSPENSRRSFFSNNNGSKSKNTYPRASWKLTGEIPTTFTAINEYEKIEGVTTYGDLVHFSNTTDNSPVYDVNNKKQFLINAHIIIKGTQGNIVTLLMKKVNVNTLTEEDIYFSEPRAINNNVGSNDFTSFNLIDQVELTEHEAVEIFIKKNNSLNSVTCLIGSVLTKQRI